MQLHFAPMGLDVAFFDLCVLSVGKTNLAKGLGPMLRDAS